MPQYLTPGVYVEEVPSAVKPIAGAGTSTAGFIGDVEADVRMPLRPGRTGVKPAPAPAKTAKTAKTAASASETTAPAAGAVEEDDFYQVAAAGTAVLVTGWESFKNQFGDIQAGNRVLAHAVYGFFNNGGSRAWVTRVTSVTDDNVRDALAGFAAIDEIAVVAVPGGTTPGIYDALISHCENSYLQDRFAILDGALTGTMTKAAIADGAADSSYAALYYPWIDVGDVDADGAPRYQPPSGHLAGVFARVDATRGVHKAPANEPIRGALGVSTLVGKADQAGLNPVGVNVIRQFDGSVTVWGARTLAGPGAPEWNYVSSRRFFNFLRESIDEGTRWAVFEPNDAALWSKVRRNIGAFLNAQWAAGALFGATPEEAYYVRCDETTNPPEVRDLGQLVTEIGVSLVRPAEFVVFRISQWSGTSE